MEAVLNNMMTFGVNAVITAAVITLVYKYFEKKVVDERSNFLAAQEESKKKSDLIYEQNRQLIEFVMDNVKENNQKLIAAIDSMKTLIEEVASDGYVHRQQYKVVAELGLRLFATRLKLLYGDIIDKNSLVDNRELIVRQVDQIFETEFNWLMTDIGKIKVERDTLIKYSQLFKKHQQDCVVSVKHGFVEVVKGYKPDIVKRTIFGYIEDYLIATIGELNKEV